MNELPELQLEPLPEVDLRHILILTDDTGIAQHAAFGTPDLHHGYCTDDNARALIAAVMAMQLNTDGGVSEEASKSEPDALLVALHSYLAFLNYAFNKDTGRFRNFMGFDRRWREELGSQDSHARALWALGVTVTLGGVDIVTELAERLFRDAFPTLKDFDAVRPWAYGILGISEFLKAEPDDELEQHAQTLGQQLFSVWHKNATTDWPWWEDRLTWGNAKLPHALLELGDRLESEEMVAAGLKALRWLLQVQTAEEGHLSIIGNAGWYVRGRSRAKFDQQPIEAKALVQGCLSAARVSRDEFWTREALRCFEWFVGRNDLGIPVYNGETGGCHDGLQRYNVNANQGAESTLAYLLSVLELHRYCQQRQELSATTQRRGAMRPGRAPCSKGICVPCRR
jgi:hypothetical protein